MKSSARHAFTRHAFTLVEALIALALAGVVITLGLLLLRTTHQVAREIRRPVHSPLESHRSRVEFELDRLLPNPPPPATSPFALSSEEGASWVSLLPGENGIPHAFLVSYGVEDGELIRRTRGGIPSRSTTNVVASAVRRFVVRAVADGESATRWPQSDGPALPDRLEWELELESGEALSTGFFLPASIRVKPPLGEPEPNAETL